MISARETNPPARATAASRPVCIFVSTRAYGMASSRLAIVEAFVMTGWRTIIAGARDRTTATLERAGAEFVELPFTSGAIDAIADFTALRELRTLYADRRPRLIHHHNVKPIVLGGAAASAAPRATVINTVTGRGQGLIRGGLTAHMLRLGLGRLLRRAAYTIFQNADDLGYFVNHELIAPERARLVRSSGVETDRFNPTPTRPRSDGMMILLAGRLVWCKGVREFAAAATRVRARFPGARFCIAGEQVPGHKDAVSEQWLNQRIADGTLDYLGRVADMPALLARTDVLVLPCVSDEGTPRAILEASSCGVPIVTTDVAGSREAVQHGATGFIVRAGDVDALVLRIEQLLEDAPLRVRMGQAGRRLMVERFDRRTIIEQTMNVYRLAGIDIPLNPRPSG